MQAKIRYIMQDEDSALRKLLAKGPVGSSAIERALGVAQSTVSRRLTRLGPDVLRVGGPRSGVHALRDSRRGVADVPVYRVDDQGRVGRLGVLVPVYTEGWVMRPEQGQLEHFEGLPWWLSDMRPAGYLGRAYAARHALALGLSPRLTEWGDTEHLRALMAHGHDCAGNLLLGDLAREHYLSAPPPVPVPLADRGPVFARLAEEAARGETPGSSAGGEQPKFAACVESPDGPLHVIVKHSMPGSNPVTDRWADLLLAEHHALTTLRESGVSAARSEVVDHDGRRYLQVDRFDRVGAAGRLALMSLGALEAEFVGAAPAAWPELVARLADGGTVDREAVAGSALLYAFGTLIGNTDMHPGNLSFVGAGRPYALAPAYDMLPMGFAPMSTGAMRDDIGPAVLRASVPAETWRRALELAGDYALRLGAESRWSAGWAPCSLAFMLRLAAARNIVARLG